jgi:glycosyltransferase involved in cell wall biosynthesis
MTTGVTGLVVTRNAGKTLDLSLRSLASWVDELLVVDMASDDDTRDIARRHGARVLDHPPVGYADPARGFGAAAAAHDWIMMLDADEVIPRPLSRRLREIAASDEADYVVIGWRNHLFGKALERGPFGPRIDRHARFFKRDAIVLSSQVHTPPTPVSGARMALLEPVPKLCVFHFAYADISEWLTRMDRYTSLEAAESHKQGQRVSTARILGDAFATFFRGYVKARGFRDGWRGLHTCLLLAVYRLVAGLKVQQLEYVGSGDHVHEVYARIAAELLDEPQ